MTHHRAGAHTHTRAHTHTSVVGNSLRTPWQPPLCQTQQSHRRRQNPPSEGGGLPAAGTRYGRKLFRQFSERDTEPKRHGDGDSVGSGTRGQDAWGSSLFCVPAEKQAATSPSIKAWHGHVCSSWYNHRDLAAAALRFTGGRLFPVLPPLLRLCGRVPAALAYVTALRSADRSTLTSSTTSQALAPQDLESGERPPVGC